MEAAVRVIRNLQLSAGTVTLLHPGPASEMTTVKLPENTDRTWNRVAKTGNPADIILETAAELAADLIVMTTDGPEGFLDGLRGDHVRASVAQGALSHGEPAGRLNAWLRLSQPLQEMLYDRGS